MARVISDILDADTLRFKHVIDTWEARSGKHGHDLKLYSDMRSRAVSAIKELGLDPSDTISGELYFALQERANQDNEWLAAKIGILREDEPEVMIKKVIAWVEKNAHSTSVWVCKPVYIRNFFKKQPPKILMKALGLRSVDSMLKRNNPAEIVTLAFGLESPEWIKKFKLNYKKCKTTDFDVKDIQFFIVSEERTAKIKRAGFPVSRFISANNELGGVLVIPPATRFPLDVLATLVSISEVVFEMRKHSSLYRMLSVRKDFGQLFYQISQEGITKVSQSISEIGWNSIHRHLVGNEYAVSKLEQPHLTKEDLYAESSLNLLESYDERFKYWNDLEFSVYAHDSMPPVSLNLVDVVTNASNRRSFSSGAMDYARMRLWEELWARYLNSDNVVDDVIDSYLKQ